eukprot:XP_001692109.1 predicted protein [Chlamydomonas reinhardtii]
MLALHKGQRAKNARVVSGFKPGDRVRLLEGKALFDKEKATYSQQIYTVTRQEGYRFAVEGKRRLYRPSEMQLVRGEVTDRVTGGAKRQAEAAQEQRQKPAVGKRGNRRGKREQLQEDLSADAYRAPRKAMKAT